MPYIIAKTNTEIPKEKEQKIVSAIGAAVTSIGKSEAWLMVELEDNCRLYFKGSTAKPTAFVEVKLLGKAGRAAYEALTAKICDILKTELGIDGSNTYVKYEEIDNWGYNGGLF